MSEKGEKNGNAAREVNGESRTVLEGINSIKEVTFSNETLRMKFQQQIQDEHRNKLINDAKLRALTNGTTNYEQFRQIWMAAHLHPMDKKESLDSFKNAKVIWNTASPSKKGEDSE